MNCGIENRSEGTQNVLQQRNCREEVFIRQSTASVTVKHVFSTWTLTVAEKTKGISWSEVIFPPVLDRWTQPPQNPSICTEISEEIKQEGEERENKGGEVCIDAIHKKKERVWSLVGEINASPLSHSSPPQIHWTQVRYGYVGGLSGLLTGLPPFITTGSLVLLLGGTATLGNVSPTSCKDGSLYIATGGAGMEEKSRERRKKTVSMLLFAFWNKLYRLY